MPFNFQSSVGRQRCVSKGMVRLITERNKWKQLSSARKICFTGVFTTLLAASCAFSQTAPTEPAVRGSGSEASGQQQPKGTASASDADAEIIRELERMRNRIQELESQLKQRHVGTTAVADSAKAAAGTPEQLVSGSVSSSQAAGQTESSAAEKPAKAEPFAFADWTWLNGNPRTKEAAFDSKFFTPEVRADVAYHYDFNHPKDDTIGGSSEVFRSNEISLTHLGVGGDFHYDNVRARVFTQLGLY